MNIMLFLQSIFLQTGNPLVDFINSVFQPQESSVGGTIVVAPNWIPLVSFIIIVVLLLLLFRFMINSRRRPNDEEPVGIIEFVVQKLGRFEGYVNKYESPMRVGILRALRRNPKFTDAIDVLIKLKEENKIFFYQMYYRDVKSLIISTLRRSRTPALIISPSPLESNIYAWSQTEPKFSLVSLGWDYMKTCMCHQSTEKFEIEIPSGDTIDVWVISPIPMIKEKTLYDQRKNESTETEKEMRTMQVKDGVIMGKNRIVINVLPYSEELATIASSMFLASRQVEFIEDQQRHMDSQDAEIQEAHGAVNRLRQINNKLKLLVGQKKLIGLDKPISFNRVQDYLVWIVMASLISMAGTQLPVYILQLRDMHPLMGGVLGLIIVVGAHMFTRKKEPPIQEELSEDGVNTNP